MYNNSNYRGGFSHSQGRNQQRNINKDFFNPYTFVPFAEKVYLLDNKEKTVLSHDIPFENSLSGSICVNFESVTPLCVCGENGNNTNVSGKYFIPGTSIKGMIRNVFEIITLSNARNGISNKRYSMRDLRNNAYELKAANHPQKSGFLIQINGKYYIHPCRSEKCSYKEIEKEEGVSGLKECRSVKDKYAKLKSPIVEYEDGSFTMWFFSGFMNNKKHEYLFDIPNAFNKLIPLHENEYQDFIFIHEKENENASWKFWKRKLKNYKSVEDISRDGYKGIVPCFFRSKVDDKGNTCVKDLGFSFLYRQPYQKKIHDFLPSVYSREGIDMTQSIFGYVNGAESLKGRVQFETSFIENARTQGNQTFILGSPKPTYYPFYLEQNNPNELKTYFSDRTYLSGYKRYLVRQSAVSGQLPPSKVTKAFVPLTANTKFTANIHFHNLRDYELGAMIAAITFCNKQSTCFHSLGIAKPYGYGKLRVNNISISLRDGQKLDYYYQAFITKLCNKVQLKGEKEYLDSLSYLFKVASGRYDSQKSIRYPQMNDKEFETIKNQKLSLSEFSPII